MQIFSTENGREVIVSGLCKLSQKFFTMVDEFLATLNHGLLGWELLEQLFYNCFPFQARLLSVEMRA
ncbi:MAG: hypothetical protein ETSY2_50125 [Candidatus Entotheonella gemina]|uniref:Uncharacterized protein n=1 Tax=Candidatus Entotheonella gemina TaxID=1429439 RepID=W4L869_9BACT|nr:MAG: hypothetical protein ETSY2_50125 [Candidatus Entotheonella gemina]